MDDVTEESVQAARMHNDVAKACVNLLGQISDGPILAVCLTSIVASSLYKHFSDPVERRAMINVVAETLIERLDEIEKRAKQRGIT